MAELSFHRDREVHVWQGGEQLSVGIGLVGLSLLGCLHIVSRKGIHLLHHSLRSMDNGEAVSQHVESPSLVHVGGDVRGLKEFLEPRTIGEPGELSSEEEPFEFFESPVTGCCFPSV